MYYIILEDGSIDRFLNREDAEEKNDHVGGKGKILDHFPKENEYFNIIDMMMEAHDQEIQVLQGKMRKEFSR